MRPSRLFLALPAVVAVACSESPPAFCEGSTRFDYEPTSVAADPMAFPDDYFTTPDPSSRTGLTVKLDETNAPWLQGLPTTQTGVYAALTGLDGFGTSAGVSLRFSAPLKDVPTGEEASLASDAMMLVELSASGPVRVPFEAQLADDGANVILWPMRPLKAKTRHAVVVTTSQKDASGACISPSKPLRALLTGENVPAALAPLGPRYKEVLDALKIKAERVSAAVVFTTQSIEEDSVAVAANVSARSYSWKERPECQDVGNEPFRACRGVFTAQDFRRDGVVVDGTPQVAYDLPVELYLPKNKAGPFPVLIFGHGLGGSKEQAEYMAEVAAPLGLATVAIDAPNHGEHPTAKPGAIDNPAPAVLDFFAADAAEGTIHPLILRDHWREAAYDKLQLLKLLKDAPDLDGDGTADLNTDKLAYYGVSLGGIMASEFLANAKGIGAVVLIVPGGRVASIVSDAVNFQLVVELLKGPHSTDGEIARFFPVLQTTLEKGDSVNWAPHILKDRLSSGGAQVPNLLFGEAIGDETVPNVCNHALARALMVPELPPVVKPVGLIPVLSGGPVSANMPDGLTAAMFEFDRVTNSATGPVRKATHGSVVGSREHLVQAHHFLATWLDGKAPEIIDPYATLHTPPLR